MNDKKIEELRYYFTGYGSPHDETILKLIEQNKRYRELIENVELTAQIKGYDDVYNFLVKALEREG